jgi:hypothetical protein
MAIFNSYVKLPEGICRKDRQGEEGQGFWANGEIDEDTCLCSVFKIGRRRNSDNKHGTVPLTCPVKHINANIVGEKWTKDLTLRPNCT